MAQVRVSHRMDHSDGQPSPNYFPGGGLGFGSKRFDKRRVRAWTRLSSHPLKAFGIILGILFVVLLGILVAVDWSYFLPLDPDPAATALAASGHTVAPLVGPALASAKAAEMAKKYTVRINTFRRNDLLKQVVPQYLSCPRIDAVQVVWSDQDASPPPAKFFHVPGLRVARTAGRTTSLEGTNSATGGKIDGNKASSSSSIDSGNSIVGSQHRRSLLGSGDAHSTSSSSGNSQLRRDGMPSAAAKKFSSSRFPLTGETPRLEYELHDVDSLNNRFRPLLPLETAAVFSVDDDLHLPCATLDFAHDVWRASPSTMVGFMPRMHGFDGKSYFYHSWWHVWRRGFYSLVLTKAAFFHRDYLYAYAGKAKPSSLSGTFSSSAETRNQAMKELHDYVDEHKNCEDLAMSFLVANTTDLPAVWVRGTGIREIGSSGLSSDQARHYEARSHCMSALVQHFGRMPLVPASSKVDRATNFWFWR